MSAPEALPEESPSNLSGQPAQPKQPGGCLFYESVLRPLAFRFPAEWIHHQAMRGLSRSWTTTPLARHACTFAAGCETHAFGLRFRNPIGLAAGFDKDGAALGAWENLGFGYAEIGTLTPEAQPGNPKPRVFRYPEISGLINRLGFPNRGASDAARRFQQLRNQGRWPHIPIGINIGKQKTTSAEDAPGDYATCFRLLAPFADYIAINVSSPNTPGLRDLQQAAFLGWILQAVNEENASRDTPLPILLKIAPDLTDAELSEILGCATEHKVAGIIATNTTIDHSPIPEASRQQGGLSGRPVARRSTEVIRFIVKETAGRMPVVGVGGVFTADDAKEKLDAGAVLLQLYTGFVYGGPFTVRNICAGLRR